MKYTRQQLEKQGFKFSITVGHFQLIGITDSIAEHRVVVKNENGGLVARFNFCQHPEDNDWRKESFLVPQSAFTKDEFQRLGIATAAYQLIE